jgi:hypothetical protein
MMMMMIMAMAVVYFLEGGVTPHGRRFFRCLARGLALGGGAILFLNPILL